MAQQRYYLLAVFAFFMTIFLWLCFKVYNQQTFGFDKDVFLLSRTYDNELATNLAIGVTFLGSQTFLLPANILLGAYFLFMHKKKAYAWKIALVSLTSSGFLFLVKYLVKRPRPDSPLVDALHYSFPSGHTFTSITFFGMVVYFILTYTKNKFWKVFSVVLSCHPPITCGVESCFFIRALRERCDRRLLPWHYVADTCKVIFAEQKEFKPW